MDHFAFVAVSIALFGMTVGANIVYLRPSWFPQEELPREVACYVLALVSLTVMQARRKHGNARAQMA